MIIKPPDDAFKVLAEAWQGWPRSDHADIPAKNAIRMHDLGKIIPYITLIKLHPGGIAEYRLIGEQLKILYEDDLTGVNTDDIHCVEEMQNTFHTTLVSSLSHHLQGVIAVRDLSDSVGDMWEYRTFSLPLTDGKGEVGYAILCGKLAAPEGTPGYSWKGDKTFDMSTTHMKAVQSIDLGNGIFDFTPYGSDDLYVMPPTDIRAGDLDQ